ncbi:hypothetical protein M0G74_09905 [Microbulbifer sp. CAU 1566]|uniref:hypothetical protein n=1 Tax=Microbulbifer sp. CAU 1566 TaxID=2933269 RepID=UPI002006D544|nr:hypothetical protein [Microbulbifer sp. CAU 1566]MCK7597579.1 hypothetical protein [Microbulbifer sp. CAU 1566]
MQIYVENQRGDRYRVSAGWSSAPTIFENDLSAELLASFPTTALDQIFEQFLAKATLSQSLDQAFSGQDLLHTHQYPGAPGHFSDEHRAVYLAVKQHRLLIEEAPHGEGVLDERQTNLRGRIRMGLQKIIAEERAEAARIEAVHSKRTSLEKAGAYVGKFGSALGQGAWDLAVWTKDIAEVAMLVNPIRQQTQMLSATYDYYVHDKSFEQSSKEYLGKVKKELVDVLGFDPSTITAEQLQQAFEVAHLIYDDSALRSDITRFAKDYVKAQHSLEMTEFAGGGVFEIILTIVLAAFTGGVGGVAAMAKNGRLLARFKDVGDLMLDFAKYQKRRNALKKARGAKSKAASFSDLESSENHESGRNEEFSQKNENSRPRRRSPPTSLAEAESRLKEARERIVRGGYKPKYSDAELLDRVSRGDLNDRFYLRLVFDDAESAKGKGIGFRRDTGRAPYWATTFDMAEAADSDPEILAGLFGIEDFNPNRAYSVVIIDMDKMPPSTERESFIPTYENMALFGSRELSEELYNLDVDMDSLMNLETTEKYEKFISEYKKIGGNLYDGEEVRKFSERIIENSDEQRLMIARNLVEVEFGANSTFSGNGLTRVTPDSKYAKSIGQEYGVIETFTFERDPLTIGELEGKKIGAVKVIPATLINGG